MTVRKLRTHGQAKNSPARWTVKLRIYRTHVVCVWFSEDFQPKQLFGLYLPKGKRTTVPFRSRSQKKKQTSSKKRGPRSGPSLLQLWMNLACQSSRFLV